MMLSDQGFILNNLPRNKHFLDPEERRVRIKFDSIPDLDPIYLERYVQTEEELNELYLYMLNFVYSREYYSKVILSGFFYDFNIPAMIRHCHHRYEDRYLEIFSQYIEEVCLYFRKHPHLSRLISSSVNLSNYAYQDEELKYPYQSYYLVNRFELEVVHDNLSSLIEFIVKEEE